MAEYLIQDTTLTALADVIREKTGSTEAISPEEMSKAIGDIKVDDGSFVGLISGTSKHINIPQGITAIRPYAFYNFSNLFSVKIPDGVTDVGSGAFRDCSVLQSLTLPNSVTSIGTSTFTGCKLLLSFIIPDSVTTIGSSGFGDGVFAQCTGLRTVTIGKNVERISGPMFYGCTALRTVIFRGTPDIAQQSGAYPFLGLTGLDDIYVPWSEGQVAGAPWGATNATIHYNSKVED